MAKCGYNGHSDGEDIAADNGGAHTRVIETPELTSFKQYIIDEYRDSYPTFAAAAFKFFHHSKVKKGKAGERPVVIDIIRVSLKLCDKDMNGLLTKSISFENNILTRACSNKLVNISPDELEIRFADALPSIIGVIVDEYNDVILEMKDKTVEIHAYAKANDIKLPKMGGKCMTGGAIIPSKYKNESIRIGDIDGDGDDDTRNGGGMVKQTGVGKRGKTVKQVFDM